MNKYQDLLDKVESCLEKVEVKDPVLTTHSSLASFNMRKLVDISNEWIKLHNYCIENIHDVLEEDFEDERVPYLFYLLLHFIKINFKLHTYDSLLEKLSDIEEKENLKEYEKKLGFLYKIKRWFKR